MNTFYLNGDLWRIVIVNPTNPQLVDRTGRLTVATTDPATYTIYMSSELTGGVFTHVLIHELGHCAMISFNLLADIHQMVKPEYWIEAEEWVCNFIADYGEQLFKIAYTVDGDYAWRWIPGELERLIS